MCGLVGLVGEPGRLVEATALWRMLAATAHRGPDGSGVWHDGRLGLGHVRLSLVDPSERGSQPMVSADGSTVLAFNGEIFHHLDHRRTLGSVAFRGGSDTETLLELLARDGLGALHELDGFWAFALVDRRRGRVSLVRDRLGVKPLYWARTRDGLAFASEMKPLLAWVGAPDLDTAYLRSFARATWVHGPRTPFAAIRRLTPGEVLTIDLDPLSVRSTHWYRLSRSVVEVEGRADADPAEWTDRLEGLLQDAVMSRMVADAPVGTLCSGGVDSSLVTALAAGLRPAGVFVASLPEQPRFDEVGWAREVAGHVGCPLIEVELRARDWMAGLVRAVWAFEHPLWHESSVALALIAGRAAELGIKAILGGEGADELFGGYDYKHQAERAAFVDACGLPAPQLTYDRRLWVEDRPIGEQLGDFEMVADDADWRAGVRADLFTAYAGQDPPRRRLAAVLGAEMQLFLSPALLRADMAMMSQGVEYREPFLARDVLACGLSMPLEPKLLPTTKGVLRAVARRHLPESVVSRTKQGFSFETHGMVDERVAKAALAGSAARHALQVGGDTWARGVEGATGRTLFRYLGWHVWHALFVDGLSVEHVIDVLSPPGRVKSAPTRTGPGGGGRG